MFSLGTLQQQQEVVSLLNSFLAVTPNCFAASIFAESTLASEVAFIFPRRQINSRGYAPITAQFSLPLSLSLSYCEIVQNKISLSHLCYLYLSN